MKYRNEILILLVFVAIGAAAYLGYNLFDDKFEVASFENENISFNYPANWNVYVVKDLANYPQTKWMVKIENPAEPEAAVVIEEVNAPNSSVEATDSITIDSVTSKMTTDTTTYRIYIFSKNNRHFQVIVYGSNLRSSNTLTDKPTLLDKSVFDEYQAHYSTILESIRVK
ncbi:MAG: hypothetical protein QME14_03935 [Methanobacteriaceae archaeon]|nr:hypothetical protein [Methanobacteriaceae archaeon]